MVKVFFRILFICGIFSCTAASLTAQNGIVNRYGQPDRMTVVPDPWASSPVSAAEVERVRNAASRPLRDGKNTDSLNFAVLNFRASVTRLERDYMDNAHTLNLIDLRFSDVDLVEAMDFITITASASPEGNTAANAKLAADRALAVKSYIMWKFPHLDRNRIFTFSIGEDWSGLYRMVFADESTPYRHEILEIIGSGIDSDAKRSRLKQLGGGRAYAYLVEHTLPYLRGAAACMIYYKGDVMPGFRSDTVFVDRVVEREVPVMRTDTVFVDRVVEVERIVKEEVPVFLHPTPPQPEPIDPKLYFWGIKTNLLYDLVLLPDLAFEFSFARRWSLELGGQWSWWNSEDPNHYYHRVQAAGVEVRRWLGRRDKTPLTGHFIGLYGMGGNYDLKFGERGVLCDDRSWSVGMTYGYATAIGRRWNLEFSLGVGYLWGEYMKYSWDPVNRCYPWGGTFNRNYIGLTKAEISLVRLLGGRNQR